MAKQIEREVGNLLITDKARHSLPWKALHSAVPAAVAQPARFAARRRACACLSWPADGPPSQPPPRRFLTLPQPHLYSLPQILQAAVCPERRRGFDGALSALASVTEVQISNDLQVAKVYLSIYRWGKMLLWCACDFTLLCVSQAPGGQGLPVHLQVGEGAAGVSGTPSAVGSTHIGVLVLVRLCGG